MKILYGAHPAVAIKRGGLYIQLLKTKSYLEKLGFEITLYDSWTVPDKKGSSLFHLFGANFSTNILGTQIKEINLPLIVTPVFFSKHSSLILRFVNRTNNFLFKMFKISTPHIYTKEVFDIADKILPNTEMEKHLIIKGFGIPEKKVTVIHNGVDERFCKATPELFVEKFGQKDFILYVGHIGDGRKNTLNLIRALKDIDTPVVFIGPIVESPYGEQCIKEIEENKNITLLDPLSHNSPLLESAYAACDTFVLPSLFETPGLAALEAGLAGAKVVITKFGGTKDYFGEDTIYIEPRSIASIHNGIKKSLEKKKTDVLKERIQKNFLWKDIAKKLAEVYLSIQINSQ